MLLIDASSSVITNIPLWWGLGTMERDACVGGKEYIENLCILLSVLNLNLLYKIKSQK